MRAWVGDFLMNRKDKNQLVLCMAAIYKKLEVIEAILKG